MHRAEHCLVCVWNPDGLRNEKYRPSDESGVSVGVAVAGGVCCVSGSNKISMLCRRFVKIASDWFMMFSNRCEKLCRMFDVSRLFRFVSVRLAFRTCSKSDRMFR